jgi:uncharacterized protein (TIGR00369 family)
VRSAIEPGSRHVTVNLDLQCLAPASGGTLLAAGRVVRLGRRLAFADADVSDEAGTTIARAQATVAVSPPPDEGSPRGEPADAGGPPQ